MLGAIPPHGTLRLDDLLHHPQFKGFPPHHPKMGSFLGTAVRVRNRVFGYLYLADKAGGFTDEDDEVVVTLAAAAAVAIQNAQLYAEAERREHWLRAGQQITTMLLSGRRAGGGAPADRRVVAGGGRRGHGGPRAARASATSGSWRSSTASAPTS